MKNIFSTEKFIKQLKNSAFVRANIPMAYVPGLPMLTELNGTLCMQVPFLKYFVTGQVDNTLVYPVKYVVTISLPEGRLVKFEDLAFDYTYAKVAFNEPVGKFRHEAIRDLGKTAFMSLKSTLYGEYDKIIAHITDGAPYTAGDQAQFVALLNRILEPSLRPFYRAISAPFAAKYLMA